jgi:hypothetical protein
MEIQEQIKEHNVTDYDFMFNSGSKLAITIDHDAGDNVQELGDRYILDTVAKPGLIDPEDSVDAETVEVFKTQLAVVARCNRKQRVPTEEEVFNTRKLLHEMTKSIQ